MRALSPDDNSEFINVCGTDKQLCIERETGDTLAPLLADNNGTYGLFACGGWPREPSCVPARTAPDAYTGEPSASDSDGDGIPDNNDNCPMMFNPPTLLSNGVQPDSNNNGIGDMCDSN